MNGPILIFGMPRSGTTWVGKLFDSHPDTLYRHEPDSVQRLRMPLFPETEAAPQYRAELEAFLSELPRMRSPDVVGKQPLFPKSYQSGAALSAYRVSVIVAKVASRVHRHTPSVCRPTADNGARARVVWKSIESPGRLGVIMDALPQARAIHLMRHPCGYVASMLRGHAARRFRGPELESNNPWLLKLLLATSMGRRHELRFEDAKRLSYEERLAWRWVLTQEKMLTDTASNDRVLTVRYEDICARPCAETKRMFEFTGLDWKLQTEAFVSASTQTAANVTDTDYYSVYKSSQASAERWRSELAPEVIERVLGILRGSTLSRFYDGEKDLPTLRAAVT